MTQVISNIAKSETNKNTRPFLAYFGHHKAGSSTIVSMLASICSEMCLKPGPCFDAKTFNYDLKNFIEVNKVDFLLYTNADYQYTRSLTNYKGFHVVRDPRDTLVSAYFSHFYSHPTTNWPELIPHREKLSRLSKDEGLIAEMDFSDVFFQQMYSWNYAQSNIYEIKMEDLFRDSSANFTKIFRFLGLLNNSDNSDKLIIPLNLIKTINKVYFKTNGIIPFHIKKSTISQTELLEKVDRNSFKNKAKGRKKGQENVKSHYRKGVSGDWKNHLTTRHIKLFKDKYNDLVLKLGYESNPDWWKDYV
jgi:hypothetical protein